MERSELTIYSKMINFLLLPLFWFSYFLPKKRNLWVFGAWFGERYSDNSQYLFEYVCKKYPHINAIWMTKSKNTTKEHQANGYMAKLINSLRGYFITATAEVVVLTNGYSDVNRFGLARSNIFQLWHGIPLKKIKKDDIINENKKSLSKNILKRINPLFNEKYSLAFAQSKTDQKRFASAFSMEIENVKITGSARDDIILLEQNKIGSEFPMQIDDRKRKILFAPTFRQSINSIFSSLTNDIIEKLSTILKKYNAELLINAHYADKTEKLKQTLVGDKYPIYLIDNESIDINKLLPQIDVLLTDYSSIYFDYLQLNRPIIFTSFDVVEYQQQEREFYDDYIQVTPGEKANNWIEVVENLEDILQGNDNYSDARKELDGMLHVYQDTLNCERIINEINNYIGENNGK